MGLFDEILCEYPLPDWPEGEEPLFQTKDLDCLMEQYRITADRRLLSVQGRDAECHGYIVFHTSVERADGREWFEYRAKFTDGLLVDLQRVDKRALLRPAEAGA